jgi:hypothetical protein
MNEWEKTIVLLNPFLPATTTPTIQNPAAFAFIKK